MRLQIRVNNFRIHDTERNEMERRLLFALGRFSEQVSLVTVNLVDLNGPRGGVDKQCQVIVRLARSGKVTISETHTNASAAVALAAGRAGRAVGQELSRRREARHPHRSRAAWSDGLGTPDSSCSEGAHETQ
jgi:putative sigma-54 modulation protein